MKPSYRFELIQLFISGQFRPVPLYTEIIVTAVMSVNRAIILKKRQPKAALANSKDWTSGVIRYGIFSFASLDSLLSFK